MHETQHQHPHDCSCCWITGYGVDETHPEQWSERLFSIDEECEHHGPQVPPVTPVPTSKWL